MTNLPPGDFHNSKKGKAIPVQAWTVP